MMISTLIDVLVTARAENGELDVILSIPGYGADEDDATGEGGIMLVTPSEFMREGENYFGRFDIALMAVSELGSPDRKAITITGKGA